MEAIDGFGAGMVNILAAVVVALAGFYFLALGVLAFTAPARISGFLMGFATSASTHYLELVVRVIVGTAFIVNATAARFSTAFAGFGWVLVGTTAVLFLVPWKVHRRFAERAVPEALRYLPLVGVASLVLGAFVLWSVVRPATG